MTDTAKSPTESSHEVGPQGVDAPRQTDNASPMMAQYLDAKAAHPDCLVFFRMGDFYELFFDDAVKAARALDITLTRRGQHGGGEIPMAGVPAHAHESYLARLIRQGFRIAICDQVESPAEAKKRSGKTLVRREVVRIVTPGTVTEETLLESRAANNLVAIARVGGRFGVAAADITVGRLMLEITDVKHLDSVLARLDPGEILIADSLRQDADIHSILEPRDSRVTLLPAARFNSESALHRLCTLYGVETLDAYGTFDRCEIAACGALVGYIDLTQQGHLPHLCPPERRADGATMEIDAATRRSLELTRNQSGERSGSLLATLDRTITGPGARLLAQHLAAPSTDPAAINSRLDAVQLFVDDGNLRIDLREILRAIPDMERALSRLTIGRGGPRDLAAIRDGLSGAQRLSTLLAMPRLDLLPDAVARAQSRLTGLDDLMDKLARALSQTLPVLARDGGFIAPGFAPDLDETRTARDEGRRLIAGLQHRYAEASGVGTLKIKHNNVLGYFIEVSPTNAEKLTAEPAAQTFIHRQTLASAVRFTTTELAEMEKTLAQAGDRAIALELDLFAQLSGAVTAASDGVAEMAAALAVIDVFASHAEIAAEQGYTRPTVDLSHRFRIVSGRHPVVEAALAGSSDTFVANDCDLSQARRLWLLTGPNMAGKSTFLRQNALVAIMAQIGGYVPADQAEIGIVDRLFSRVGAADDLARGRSTFMVEMVETAAILHQATPRSLVVLDEIGRGTSTYDGLSIAWATVEHLHDRNRCRALFATHYHELTALADRLKALTCRSMAVREWKGDIVFLHEVREGAADRSYGLHVAKLAGLPNAVLTRARTVLDTLERSGQRENDAAALPLFAGLESEDTTAPVPEPGPGSVPLGSLPDEPADAAAEDPQVAAIRRLVAEADPDAMTPRDALDAMYRLKKLISEGSDAADQAD
ncbi:DNA mismatch repair protein MutS [Fodinicurvata sp. EGI_FJ10296]|uniref:DNA mismatch repair protein MutS n=1 Tax=Fodinicurvata sp. EGI_FJ10296 TaxID=3231908 RepID=UPI003453B3AB